MATLSLQSYICSQIISDVFLRTSPAALLVKEELVILGDIKKMSSLNRVLILNILLQTSNNTFPVCFIVTGKKYNEYMLKKNFAIAQEIIYEICVPFNSKLLKNIKREYPEELGN